MPDEPAPISRLTLAVSGVIPPSTSIRNFVLAEARHRAAVDAPVELGHGSTCSQPSTVRTMALVDRPQPCIEMCLRKNSIISISTWSRRI